MELAKITTKGQITIPVQIRKMLNLKEGDKVVFIQNGSNVIMENSTKLALKEAQEGFVGVAEKLGLKTEQDVVDLIKQVRQEVRDERLWE